MEIIPCKQRLWLKFTFFSVLLLLLGSNSYAEENKAKSALNQPITLKFQNTELSVVLREIEDRSGIHFIYSTQMIDASRKVSIDASDRKLAQVLTDLLTPLRIDFEPVGGEIVLKRFRMSQAIPLADNNTVLATNKKTLLASTITGKITSSNGEPLPGVTVLVKGTTTGTASGADGSYTITAPADNGTLVFSFIGYTTKEVAFSGSASINVTLLDDTKTLDEVVVTALGIKREKKALTYAVSEVGGEKLTQAREINVGNALAGRVAGVTSSGTSGGPGSSSRIVIRGNGSLNGENQPLYVVNGMPITNNNQGSAGTFGGVDRGDGLASINPDDIESISVLKGGTAAALYGARAANGVILITTKSGKAQKGIGVEYNTNYTLQQAINLLDWQYEYGSGSLGAAPTTEAQAIANGRMSWGARLDGSPVVQPDGQTRPYSAQKNNFKNFYQTGTNFVNTLALTGGNELARFRFSASNLDNKAIVPHNTMNIKTFNLSASATLAKKIVFEGNAQYNIENVKNRTYLADFQQNPNTGAQLLATNIPIESLSPGYLPNGNEFKWSDYEYATNPYFAINKVQNGDTKKRFIGSFNTTYNITDALYVRARFGIDQVNFDGYAIQPTGLAFNQPGSMTTDQSVQSETNLEGTIGYRKDIGAFSINVFAGGNQMRNTFDGVSLSSGQFNRPYQYFIANGRSQNFGINYSELGINSLFASADIDFNNYLYLTLTGRNDWFSTLDPENNSLFYPSVGLSFVASDAWATKPGWLDYAKIRTSWAQVGGGAPNAYAITQTFSAQSQQHLGQTLMNVTSATLPTLLTPYTSTTTELGIETKVLNNRLGIDVTLYDRTTTNDIVNATLPQSSGYTAVALNVGKMKNRGIELMLSGSPIASESGLSWNMALNTAYNKNEVISIAPELGLTSLRLPGATTRTENGWITHYQGQPFGQIAGSTYSRDANGQIIYNSSNGIPIASSVVPLGKGVPPLALGLNNDFSFKNFNLSFLLDSRWGGSIYSATSAYGTQFGLDKRTVENNVRENGVTVTGVNEKGEAFTKNVPAETYYKGIWNTITSEFVEKADFIKLRSFNIGYTLPSKLLAKTPFQSANISFVGRNLLILYRTTKNIDPESNYSSGNAQGLENFGLPSTRTYGFNLSVRL
ncbi:SusC/RagA family TonB-linked outer membrane protein [Adhaeribacter radiodurans]|uniref:SusC/RagA family TonB-linked outer membrane protein n=1 Tax=Adhaeribacter radiodurans TaxID=2745197 RepID=A0A7L7L604_9BACT|nr:SusC/RagA family TonB-linked outer membrane protein [Adhaeribacter radiodurans]QMU28251.1 SusC/RagA family TonB-linked outer membrane protein [Adhaeribacter radiodurans]